MEVGDRISQLIKNFNVHSETYRISTDDFLQFLA